MHRQAGARVRAEALPDLKALIKRVVFGGDTRPRRITRGLLRGLTFVVDPQNQSQRLLGLYEKEIESHVRAAAARARTAIDVGAHDGWYTTFFASRANIAKVLACDRNPNVLDRLMRNVALNDLAGKVTLHDVEVGSAQASRRPLDELLGTETPPFAIKIDTDGGELDVLTSGRTVLSGTPCDLIVETHSVELEAECLRYVQGLGYRTRVIPNGWYRRYIPELRTAPHNRWFVAYAAFDLEARRVVSRDL